MAKRPEFINNTTFATWLKKQGKSESMVAPVISDANLIIPFLLTQLDQANFEKLVNTRRYESGFENEDSFWHSTSIPWIMQWASEETELFSKRKEAEKLGKTKKKS